MDQKSLRTSELDQRFTLQQIFEKPWDRRVAREGKQQPSLNIQMYNAPNF